MSNNAMIEPNRKIIISTDIDEEIAEEVIARIIDINDLDEERKAVLTNYEPEPIEIFINSGGGSATDGFAIIGAMDMSSTPIITYGMGMVASMALGIFMNGDIRVSTRHTRFMYHSVAYGAIGYIKDHEDAQKESDLLQRMYNSLFKDTKITKEMMKEIRDKKSNFFFSAKEAKNLGIIHEIVEKTDKQIEIIKEEE